MTFYALQPLRKYAKMGDELQLITRHADVLILENEQGVRFPARQELVGDEKPEEVVAEVVKVVDLFNQPIV